MTLHVCQQDARGGLPGWVYMTKSFASVKSTRHESGYALRFPWITKIRPDKLPSDADTLETVVKLFEGQSKTSGRPESWRYK
jgi:hypothetical protein